jgi:hypothetical protein
MRDALLALSQSSVFRLRLDQNREIGVGVFPERKEVLVGGDGLAGITGQSECPAQFESRQRANRIGYDDPAVIENVLEFRGGLCALVCS